MVIATAFFLIGDCFLRNRLSRSPLQPCFISFFLLFSHIHVNFAELLQIFHESDRSDAWTKRKLGDQQGGFGGNASREISKGDGKRREMVNEGEERRETKQRRRAEENDRRIRRNLLVPAGHARTDYPSIILGCLPRERIADRERVGLDGKMWTVSRENPCGGARTVKFSKGHAADRF